MKQTNFKVYKINTCFNFYDVIKMAQKKGFSKNTQNKQK